MKKTKKHPHLSTNRSDAKLVSHFFFTIRGKIVLAFGILTLFLVSLTVTSYVSVKRLQEEIDYVIKHDLQTNNESRELAKAFVDIETGQHGFVITGDDEFLIPYNEGKKVVEDKISNLL
ncbi:CHASE3 domain-containing protein [Anoxybacillus ayderensis]|uniref:CHASE3 domain-containing protein n=1 Tax=Anoxybacillus ayderensis TaxID=265546 RepID=UPI002E1AE6FB|nr:CHASE3 domain-containing protein [Anoxybacillus ayderensis]